ncbi:MAG TPA: CAP domain-containing protein [Acidimicrobiales bacterium]|nr:CAP domain-containing protein [Acidimicrobiales bacterium]
MRTLEVPPLIPPTLAKRAGLAAAVLSLPLATVSFQNPASASTTVPTFDSAATAYLAYSVEADRTWVHASQLSLSPSLDQVALAHAYQMAEGNYLFDSPYLAGVAGPYVPGWLRLGENSAYGATAVAAAWTFVHSPPHLANILGPYNEYGVAAVRSGGTLWVAEVFAYQG